MYIKRGNSEFKVPNWLVVVGILALDNIVSNGMRIKALKVLEKAEDSQ